MSVARMDVTKRVLGESYIAATGLLLGLVLVGRLLVDGPAAMMWGTAGAVPVVVLVASIYWFDRIGFGDDQVWTVAVYSAVSLGFGSVFVVVLETVPEVAFSSGETFLLVTGLGMLTVAGGLAGVVRELRRTNRRLTLRNQVLHRVLRHNLRNDMSVVLCLLDELEAEADADPAQRERVGRARDRIESLVDLTDKVRKVSATVDETGAPPEPVDISALVDRRVERLRAEYPIDVETDLPDSTMARINGEFELVLDNIIQSAAENADSPELCVSLDTDATTVALRVEDRDWALPDADLSAVTNGAETALEHGLGLELWLVYWLVDSNGGDIEVATADGARRVDIHLDRAAGGWLPRKLA
jgi:signal transduction histidine kinase